MKRAYTARNVRDKKFDVFNLSEEWALAFDKPERHGVWFVWGDSGNGKTNFVMQLCKELARHGRVIYNSLEEGVSLSMCNTLIRAGMEDVGSRFLILDKEPMIELEERMNKPKSPDIYVVDSLQYTGMNFDDYRRFREANSKKLIIFISQGRDKKPDGAVARKVMFDADLKIYIEGFQAESKGRFIGKTGLYTIWEEGARRYWGDRRSIRQGKEDNQQICQRPGSGGGLNNI